MSTQSRRQLQHRLHDRLRWTADTHLHADYVSGGPELSRRATFFAPRAALILLWVGFFAMFRGFTEIFLAFEIRRASKELSTA